MLEKLLSLLQKGESYSAVALAEALGVRPNAVAAYIEYLEKEGILKQTIRRSGCPHDCAKCAKLSPHALCHANDLTVWEVVPENERRASR